MDNFDENFEPDEGDIKPGTEVVVMHIDGETLLGIGTYVGEFPFGDDPENDDFPDSKIRLHSNDAIIWGSECWWSENPTAVEASRDLTNVAKIKRDDEGNVVIVPAPAPVNPLSFLIDPTLN